MSTLSQDLAPRHAPLEYWFAKLHAGSLAFLVDFIVRRATGQAEVRVSLWVRGRGRVARSHAHSTPDAAVIAVAGNVLDTSRSVGAVDDVAWDLTYQPQAGRVAPTVPMLSRLHPFDLELVSRPQVAFTGHVTVAGERFDVAEAHGSLTHYWGRRLPDRWHWISANAFGESDLILEAVAMVTRLWGRRPSVAVGYLWTQQAGRQDLVISPLTGLISVAGSVDDYTLVVRRPGRTMRLRCCAPPDRYNDLGEGIHQTLHGSCSVDAALVDPHAGLEYRIRPAG